MFGISMALVHIAQTIAKHNAREAHINSLTPEEQAAIRAAGKRKRRTVVRLRLQRLEGRETSGGNKNA